jgi:hypothetical protein
MVRRTSAFYLVHAAFGMTDRSLDWTHHFLVVVRDLLFVAAPVMVPLYMGFVVQASLVTGMLMLAGQMPPFAKVSADTRKRPTDMDGSQLSASRASTSTSAKPRSSLSLFQPSSSRSSTPSPPAGD